MSIVTATRTNEQLYSNRNGPAPTQQHHREPIQQEATSNHTARSLEHPHRNRNDHPHSTTTTNPHRIKQQAFTVGNNKHPHDMTQQTFMRRQGLSSHSATQTTAHAAAKTTSQPHRRKHQTLAQREVQTLTQKEATNMHTATGIKRPLSNKKALPHSKAPQASTH